MDNDAKIEDSGVLDEEGFPYAFADGARCSDHSHVPDERTLVLVAGVGNDGRAVHVPINAFIAIPNRPSAAHLARPSAYVARPRRK